MIKIWLRHVFVNLFGALTDLLKNQFLGSFCHSKITLLYQDTQGYKYYCNILNRSTPKPTFTLAIYKFVS